VGYRTLRALGFFRLVYLGFCFVPLQALCLHPLRGVWLGKSVAKAKPIAKTICRDAAVQAIQRVLLARLEEMCKFRERALDWEKPDGVHDMRVASRRLRSALKDFKPYLRRERVPSRKLKAIANSLGAVRDEDVVLAALDELRLQGGDQVVDGIEAIAEEHRLQRRQARSVLEAAIRPAMLAELRSEFQASLDAATRLEPPPGEKSERRVLTFGQIATDVIGARLKHLSEAGHWFYHPLRTRQLHKLRILTKRLRYAIELFAPCVGEEFERVAKEISRLQSSLGELHDCDVWIASLGTRLKKADKAPDHISFDQSSQEAAVWLLRHFVSERTKHYCDALIRWHEWETEGFLDRLRGMLPADK
jgi:CHAD domain-containing protein